MLEITRENIVDGYFAWLKDSTFFSVLNDTVTRISLPFLDRNNDYTEIYMVRRSENEFFLTDDGATYSELEFSGFNFTKDRLKILNTIIASHGVSMDGNNALCVTADSDSLFFKKHMLLQCIVKVSDMFILKNPRKDSLFTEDIAAFLDENNVRYTPNISISGKSKLLNYFDFAVPGIKNRNIPDKFIKGISNLDNQKARLLIFGWEDIREARDNTEMFVFVNGVDKSIRASAFSSLQEYDIKPFDWQHRKNTIESLTA